MSSAHFEPEFVKRSHDDIDDMCRTMREHVSSKSGEFAHLSYEDGCVAVVKWLFFATGKHPADMSPDDSLRRVQQTQREILENERQQAREGSDA